MNHRTVKALAAATILAMGVAACSSSSSSSSSATTSTSTKQGAPLVIVDNTGQVFAQTFNPYVSTSLGVEDNMQSMTYEPLYEFNIMQPTQAPIPWLATGYAWSNGGKTLTFTIRPGVKFSDGTPMTASDVAFTFNLLMKNTTLTSQAPAPTPLPVSATAPNATTAVLTFSQPEYANLFLIGSTYILPQHVWQSVSNPATYADANPVGTGPYELGSFSSQKVTFKQNPYYWQKSKVTVPEVIFPNYVSNTTANPALDSGQIGYAGNDVANVASDYLSANPANHTWTSNQPWFADNNVVTLWLNTTKAPLNDPKVRLAISAGIDRAQLSAQGETNYEPPATSSSGLLLPTQSALLDPSYNNDISPTTNAAKVTQLLTSDGYTKSGGKWTKNGQPIKFSIEDPSSYTDYATDAQLIANQLNAEGFEVSFDGVQATQWYNDYPVGNFDAIIHWSNQGPTPYDYFDYWMDNSLSAPIGKPAGSDYGRYNNPQVQAALAQYAGTDNTATQQQALNTLETIVATQAPVIPLLYGAAWYEYSTKDYTGWPTQSNQYIDPVPNAPYMEYTLLHLSPAS
ncbi:MAG TPA: ABC transporter substrate-binding protein [Streptosporangiaceae bacterium]|nr:ABC transporter substrate-binding protein [Streptosporangiaceae bacterium]